MYVEVDCGITGSKPVMEAFDWVVGASGELYCYTEMGGLVTTFAPGEWREVRRVIPNEEMEPGTNPFDTFETKNKRHYHLPQHPAHTRGHNGRWTPDQEVHHRVGKG
jgi:hypothetical protein